MKVTYSVLALAIASIVSAKVLAADCAFCISEADQHQVEVDSVSLNLNRNPIPEFYNIKVGGVHAAGVVDEKHAVIYAGKVHSDFVKTHEIEREDGTVETVETSGRHLFFTTTTFQPLIWSSNNTLSTSDPVLKIIEDIAEMMKQPDSEIETGARQMRFNAANGFSDSLLMNVSEHFTKMKAASGETLLDRSAFFYNGADPEIEVIFKKAFNSVSASGEVNTDLILQSRTAFSAAEKCRELGDDWFLPSLYELSYLPNALKNASEKIDLVSQIRPRQNQIEALWSSNELSENLAYVAIAIDDEMLIGVTAKNNINHSVSRGYAGEMYSSNSGSFITGRPDMHTFICARH